MSQTIDTPSYTIELSDGSIRPMTVKELAIRLEQLMSADKGIAEMPVGLSVDSEGNGMPWIGDIAIWSSLLTGIRTAGVRGISGIVRCTNIFPPMKTAVSSRFGTERVVEPARAFRLPDHTPTRLGLSMCL